MDKRKRRKLAPAGWVVGSTKEFLGLTDAEAAYVDFKAALSGFLRSTREAGHLRLSLGGTGCPTCITAQGVQDMACEPRPAPLV